ncbi:MAG: hypothetical protein AAF160_10265 [Pseudomonadota bacterium]
MDGEVRIYFALVVPGWIASVSEARSVDAPGTKGVAAHFDRHPNALDSAGEIGGTWSGQWRRRRI